MRGRRREIPYSSMTPHSSAAYKMADYEEAKKSLELTVRYLEKLNPSAAASLKEGLEETLTVHKLGVTGLLRKTLSTNPIESCFSVTRTVTERVTWRNGDDTIQRRAVASHCRAENEIQLALRVIGTFRNSLLLCSKNLLTVRMPQAKMMIRAFVLQGRDGANSSHGLSS